MAGGKLRCCRDVANEIVGSVHDLHRPPTEDVRWPYEYGVPDAVGRVQRLFDRSNRATRRLRDAHPLEGFFELLAVLSPIDRLDAAAEDAEAAPVQGLG